MAQEVGLTPDRCVQLIKANDAKWQAFQQAHAIQIVAGSASGATNNIALAPEEGLIELMQLNWQTIETAQSRINDIISSGEKINMFKSLCGGLKDLQGTYLQLCKIKKLDDEHKGNSISRFTVETILQAMFPRLKTAINELSTAIKHELPPPMRAPYEQAYQKALPNYNAIITESVEKLNSILAETQQETDAEEAQEQEQETATTKDK